MRKHCRSNLSKVKIFDATLKYYCCDVWGAGYFFSSGNLVNTNDNTCIFTIVLLIFKQIFLFPVYESRYKGESNTLTSLIKKRDHCVLIQLKSAVERDNRAFWPFPKQNFMNIFSPVVPSEKWEVFRTKFQLSSPSLRLLSEEKDSVPRNPLNGKMIDKPDLCYHLIIIILKDASRLN